ncbi:Acyl-CoA N-acyltransferase (NAT) superfamily protein [Forsythia ovata]|uniref:Acyl-CoA N-acyltransferase (NAT) superfamily protein n=1 Tax=Forsythia ovata TaxID=205694 RepID=A0ABD1PJQ4_9LAMI
MSVNLDKSEGEGRVQESLEITLRPIELSEVDDFMDDKVTRFCLWDTYTSKEQALNYIKYFAIPQPRLRVICIENCAMVTMLVTPASGFDLCRGELGYVLSYNYWGKRDCD